LVLDGLSDPTMAFRPKLRPHKHAPLNNMTRNLDFKEITKATFQSGPYSVSDKIKTLSLIEDLTKATFQSEPYSDSHKIKTVSLIEGLTKATFQSANNRDSYKMNTVSLIQ
jgi:hypothetical protein